MKPITRLLLMLPGARQNGNAWSACCPAHNDRQASLSITEGTDGRAHLDCRAGCKPDAVCSTLGLRSADILSTVDEPNHSGGRRHTRLDTPSPHRIAERMRPAEPPKLPPNADTNDPPATAVVQAESAASVKPALERKSDVVSPTANHEAIRRHAVAGPLALAKTIRLSGVAPRPVRWLWPGRIALGKLTIVAGDPGLGKSFLSCDLAARVSTGGEWPDSEPGGVWHPAPPGGVVFLNCEDDLEDTIRPRLDRHGADVSRIVALAGVRELSRNRERQFDLARDLAALESAVRDAGDCRLVVIDPVTAYLGDRHDSHRTADVRALLAPLTALAAKHEIAVLAISHLNKSNRAAIYRTTGSLAFVAAARAAWCVTRDPETPDRRMFLPIKNNLGNDATGLAYSITDGRVRWEADLVTVLADDALAAESRSERRKRGPDAESHDAASVWLLSTLSGGPRPTKELVDEWTNGQGGAKRTLERAKQSLGIQAFRPATPGPWWWQLTGNTAKTIKDKQLGDLGGLV